MSNKPEPYYPSDLRAVEERIVFLEGQIEDAKSNVRDWRAELAKEQAKRRSMILDGMPLFDGGKREAV